jgi:hypothetical protein
MSDFNKVYIDPNIYYVDNFLSQEEIDYILNSEIEWNQINALGNGVDESKYDTKYFEGGGVGRRFAGQLISAEKFWKDEIDSRIRKLLDNDKERYNARPILTKYFPEGDWALYYHHENHPDCGPIGMYTTLGFTIGLNDGWVGGEIGFQNKPIEFFVKPGTIVVFPASEEYTHCVKAVRKGERIVFSAFVYNNDFYESEFSPEYQEKKFLQENH